MITPLVRNHPNPESIDWKYLDKDSYMDVEHVLTDGVTFFEPFLVDNFYPQEMFDELVLICNAYNLENVDYSRQMNKWEESIPLPQKFIDYAVNKVRELVGNDDIHQGYHMYAHHQITSEGRVPRLPLHIDWSPGPYMVDLHIGGNRDWGFVAGNTNFITKPNQAIICQPQFDYHYRPSWANNDPDEYYQALFFHLINRNHWCVTTNDPMQQRSEELNAKFDFNKKFREHPDFVNYQHQKRYIFDALYYQQHAISGLPAIPFGENPTPLDSAIHDLKNVKPAKEIK